MSLAQGLLRKLFVKSTAVHIDVDMSGNLVLTDSVSGSKTLAQLATAAIQVESGNSVVVAATTAIDFAAAPFLVTESPAGEANVDFDKTCLENGGAKELTVEGLSGQLADAQLVRVEDEGSLIGNVTAINFIGAGVSVALNGSEANVTIAGSSGTIAGTIANTQVAYGTASNTIGGDSNFTWDASARKLSIDKLNVTNGTAENNVMPVQLTLDIDGTSSAEQRGLLCSVDATGTGTGTQFGARYNLTDYSGAAANLALAGVNQASSTGTDLELNDTGFPPVSIGTLGFAGAITAGTFVGAYGHAEGGEYNVGVVGRAKDSNASGTDVGVIGAGLNGVGIAVGGYFTSSPDASNPSFAASAALVADNGGSAHDIFVARDNGTPVFKILNGGNQDFFQKQALSFVFENRTTNPSSPVEGQSYWKTDTDELMVYDGTTFTAIGGGASFNGDLAGDTLTDSTGTLNLLSDAGQHIILRAPIASGATHGQVQMFPPVDTTDTTVHNTGFSTHFGLFLVNMHDGTGRVGLFLIRGTGAPTLVVESPANSFTVTKDTANRINVYYETDQVKVQNEIGTGVLAFSFYGSNNF